MTLSDLESRDLYSVLGVEKADPSGAIHQAFVRLAPKHPPDKDPEGFKALHTAYRTLIDPKAREEYDNLMSCGEEIARLVSQSFAAMIHGRYKLAEQLIARIVEETGGASEALMLLGMVQFEQGHYRDAIQTLTELVDRFPRVALYRINLANMLMNRYESVEGDEAKEHVLSRAREQYLRAIELDERNPLAYLEMAKTHLAEKKPLEAFEWTEKAVGMKGRMAFEDFEALLYGFVVLAYSEEPSRLADQLRRIESSVPEETEARQYTAGALVNSSFGLVHDRKMEAARLLVEAASRLTPDRKALKEMLVDLELGAEADLVREEFMNDPLILKPIREMADELFEHFILRSSVDRLEAAGKDFLEKLRGTNLGKLKRSMDRMKRVYPAVWRMNEEFWRHFLIPAYLIGDPPKATPVWAWLLLGLLVAVVALALFITFFPHAFESLIYIMDTGQSHYP